MADPERFDADPALSIKIRMLLSKTFINTTSIITSFFSNISLKFIDLKRSLEKGVYKFKKIFFSQISYPFFKFSKLVFSCNILK